MKRLPSFRLTPRTCRVSLATVGLAVGLALTGCQHPTRQATSPLAPDVAATPPAGPVVPLPARTPFDDDAVLRALYLESYANGYTLAVTNSEYTSPGCRCEAQGDPRRYAAMADGFFAGREAGTEAYRARQESPQRR